MWFSAVTALAVLPSLACTAPVTDGKPQIDHDAIIVGGGPAGLAALSALARVRRNALLVDSGVYRNGPTRHMHDVLGFDGVRGAYYRWAAREQISNYDTVSMTNGTVTKITPRENNTFFTVSVTYQDKTEKSLTARKVVLGTGLKDLIPDTPGLRENWGKGIYWCPWCDGHEHADQPLGLIGPLTSVPGTVREILTLNRDLVAFVNGTDTASNRAATEKENPMWQEYLKLHRVQVENRTIASIERLQDGSNLDADPSLPSYPEHDLFRVHFTDGGSVTRAAFLTSFKHEQYSRVGEEAGVVLYGEKLGVDPAQGLVTSVPGIYAIGDCNSDNSTNVPHALYSGKRTAVFLHVQLEKETADEELAGLNRTGKRSIHDEARSLWDRMNGEEGELLYAGSFDQ
ncbi:hypothetical protein ED733_008611 [Metarhizium rileyi]|uniref:FAD/NAD(P)-binding domain-containing protein n=1 Tax=Metarhizium rileyi (strain RCEF 4871) TaxID=1649241 RepID=A0A5C6GPX6_METRR|nr:hypothetical protein ED733_008611 [Metarhizium rileyi]